MPIQLLEDRIALRHRTEQQVGRLIVPQTGRPGNYEYRDVVAVGPGRSTDSGERRPMTVRAGDLILIDPSHIYPQQVNLHDGTIVQFTEESKVIAIMPRDAGITVSDRQELPEGT